jgi:hypothetical protein
MAVWLSRRFRRWLFFTAGIPAIGWTLGRAGEELERRRGRSTSSDLLQTGGDLLNRRRRSASARRPEGNGQRRYVVAGRSTATRCRAANAGWWRRR